MDWEIFKDETTAELIAGMSIKPGEDPAIADAIFWAFFIRFREGVQIKCRIVADVMGYDTAIADDVAYEAFRKFRACTSFKPENCKGRPIDDCVQIYIGQIASRLLSDHQRNLARPKIEIPEGEIFWDLPDVELLDVEPERKAQLLQQYAKIKLVLDKLPESHKVIYLTYMYYEKFLKEGERLPRTVLKRLREEFNLTQTSIRVYKNEAFKQVETYLSIYGK